MFHVKHEGWALYEQVSGVPAPPEVRERVERYVALLIERAIPMGMVGAAEPGELFERHVLDSVRVLPLLDSGVTVADAGSGAGLPGVPVAIARPDIRVVLIEQRRQRVAFLEFVIEALGLEHAEVFAGSLDGFSEEVDVVAARALGDLERAWALTSRVLGPGGR